MRVLLASSEVHPFSKTGGLADMVGALGKALAKSGHEVGLVTPLYRGVQEKCPGIQKADWRFDLPLANKRVRAELWTLNAGERFTIHFVHQREYFDRSGLYNEHSRDYWDNGERFIFFSKCVAQLARYLPLQPEILHVHDWQTGIVPALVKQQAHEGWGTAPAVCLTIHNLAYQGVFPRSTFELTNLPARFFSVDGAEFYGQLNCLKAGIAYADLLVTVSPRYAREILTEQFGHGLDGLLRKRQRQLLGILNGVDYDEWNTTHNPHLKHPFSLAHLSGKAANKGDLQRELNLPVEPDVPLFGTITRLADQKGVEIELGALEEMLQVGMQFVLLGSGAPEYERAFEDLARRFPGKVAVRLAFDQGLSHRIEAGCDFFIMPSKYEPCGLNQMYSLRYGTIPIVRRTGGLDDAVVDAADDLQNANGIKFTEYSATALAKAIRKAVTIFRMPSLLRRYRENGMRRDFSLERMCAQYAKAYKAASSTQALCV